MYIWNILPHCICLLRKEQCKKSSYILPKESRRLSLCVILYFIFSTTIAVFLFCNKSCCWRGRKTQHKWLPESTQVLWREETWQSPMKSTAEFLLIGVRPGFHSAPWWRHFENVPLKDNDLENVKLPSRKFTHLVVIFHKAYEKRILSHLNVALMQSELRKN